MTDSTDDVDWYYGEEDEDGPREWTTRELTDLIRRIVREEIQRAKEQRE